MYEFPIGRFVNLARSPRVGALERRRALSKLAGGGKPAGRRDAVIVGTYGPRRGLRNGIRIPVILDFALETRVRIDHNLLSEATRICLRDASVILCSFSNPQENSTCHTMTGNL